MENLLHLTITALASLALFLICLLRKRQHQDQEQIRGLLEQIETMRQTLTGRIRNISVGAGADSSGDDGLVQLHKEKTFMGGTANPLTLTDVKTALTKLGADLTVIVDAETGDIRGVVQNLKDQLANGTPVTQADLQALLDQIGSTQKTLTTKIQNVSVGAGADTKGADDAGGGGGGPTA